MAKHNFLILLENRKKARILDVEINKNILQIYIVSLYHGGGNVCLKRFQL